MLSSKYLWPFFNFKDTSMCVQWFDCMKLTLKFLLQEEQKIKKKKKNTKKKPMIVEEPQRLSQDSSSPEPTPDSETNPADPEYNTGTGKTAGISQPMAPGVFLNQRRPSSSSSSQNTSSVPPAKVERGNSTDAKGELPCWKWLNQNKTIKIKIWGRVSLSFF